MKFNLKPNPTFPAKVDIPVPGGEFMTIGLVMRHRTRDELKALHEQVTSGAIGHAETITAVAVSWDADEPLTVETAAELANNYHAAASSIYNAYVDELMGARVKNS